MIRQVCRGILRLCTDVTSEEICSVDITVVSFYLEELFVKFVFCFVLQTLLAPHCAV